MFFIIDQISVLYLKKFVVLSDMEVLKSIRFLPNIYKFGEWLKCVVYQIYSTFLICRLNVDIFAQETRVFLFPKKLVLSIAEVFRNIHFFPHIICKGKSVIFEINIDFLLSQTVKV